MFSAQSCNRETHSVISGWFDRIACVFSRSARSSPRNVTTIFSVSTSILLTKKINEVGPTPGFCQYCKASLRPGPGIAESESRTACSGDGAVVETGVRTEL